MNWLSITCKGLLLLWLVLIFVALPQSTSAQETIEPVVITPADLETFFDGILAAQMQAGDIPGVSLSVVHNDAVLLAKGYGYADLERRLPVDHERSLVRIGSISKLFTWTAVMQLVEQGKLDLDTDINTYLDFQIPNTFSEPITLRHLLTHTPGFEERIIGMTSRSEADVAPMGEYLAANVPARVNPPGAFTAYSNYGSALAGHIVALTSGLGYENYVQRYILDPLAMAPGYQLHFQPGQAPVCPPHHHT